MSFPALRRLAAEHDHPTLPVDVTEPEGEHLALAHTRVQGGDDHRPQERRRDLQ
jgi:hypothetical protein